MLEEILTQNTLWKTKKVLESKLGRIARELKNNLHFRSKKGFSEVFFYIKDVERACDNFAIFFRNNMKFPQLEIHVSKHEIEPEVKNVVFY